MQYIKVANILPSSKEGDFVVKFNTIAWLLMRNKYFTKPDEALKGGGHIPVYHIFQDRKKIGIVVVHTTDSNQPYLMLLKKRQQQRKGRISSKTRKYYIFNLNEDYSPVANTSVLYKVYANTRIY